jgi:hypothetical protein
MIYLTYSTLLFRFTKSLTTEQNIAIEAAGSGAKQSWKASSQALTRMRMSDLRTAQSRHHHHHNRYHSNHNEAQYE